MARSTRTRLRFIRWCTLIAALAAVSLPLAIGRCGLGGPDLDRRAGDRDLIRGLGFSPFRDCQSPHVARRPSPRELREDVDLISTMGNAMRTYASAGLTDTVEYALNSGLRVSVGAWLGPETSAAGRTANRAEIDAAVTLANTLRVESVIVGNEVVLRDDLPPERLAHYITEVKGRVDVPVTTAETASIALNRAEYRSVLDAVDYVLVHIYPYWNGVHIDGAAWYVAGVFRDMQAKAVGKEVVIGETGWPSGGRPRGRAVPDPVNAERFLAEWTAVAAIEDIPYYYFTAFDEPWKDEGGVGPYWGLYNTARGPKFAITTLLDPPRRPPPWVSVQPLPPAVSPTPAAGASPSAAGASPQADLTEPLTIYETWPAAGTYLPGLMGDAEDVTTDDCTPGGTAEIPKRGAVDRAIKITYRPRGHRGWAGVYWLHPEKNWGTRSRGGRDLTGYTAVTFSARGERGGERITFFAGGITGAHPDTLTRRVIEVTLSDTWERYVIDIRRAPLTRVSGAFGWSATGSDHPTGATFYLDDIQVDRSLPAE